MITTLIAATMFLASPNYQPEFHRAFLTTSDIVNGRWDCKAATESIQFCLDATTAPKDRTKPFLVKGLYVDSDKKQVAQIGVRFDCKAGTVQLFSDHGNGVLEADGPAYQPKPGTISGGHLEDFCPVN